MKSKLNLVQKDEEVAQYINDVKSEIIKTIRNTVPEVEEYVKNTFGKHVRSTLFFLATKALKPDCVVPVEVGAAFEILHTATLMHDDVLDEADIRRGRASFRAQHGGKFSILAGDLLVCAAVELVWATKSWKFVKLYADLGQNLVKGEVGGHNLVITDNIQKYYSQIYLKTACFFESVCKMATTITCCDKTASDAIISFGEIYGRMFQVNDDYTDYFVHTAIADKQQGGDFFNQIITLPMIFAYKCANSIERQLLVSAISAPNLSTFKVAKRIMTHLKVDQLIMDEISCLANQAAATIELIQPSRYKDLLTLLCEQK